MLRAVGRAMVVAGLGVGVALPGVPAHALEAPPPGPFQGPFQGPFWNQDDESPLTIKVKLGEEDENYEFHMWTPQGMVTCTVPREDLDDTEEILNLGPLGVAIGSIALREQADGPSGLSVGSLGLRTYADQRMRCEHDSEDEWNSWNGSSTSSTSSTWDTSTNDWDASTSTWDTSMDSGGTTGNWWDDRRDRTGS
ncbi:hypothetical protein HDA32_001992 [Spinactinospora alkalitolerans]|uniref:Uncharacterized protein n=1 Tax=Spinactinospora alkalitolerans TaxID=687207 RepID=A0A852TVH7_9ACTN|nr:hypothetical protein [Spinactinospora alkalitolerans]NYE46872.1 hypothetical protein [Spinactinospora alkalitolerans]